MTFSAELYLFEMSQPEKRSRVLYAGNSCVHGSSRILGRIFARSQGTPVATGQLDKGIGCNHAEPCHLELDH